VSSRWEGDDRGVGVADAGQLVAGGSELVAAFAEPGWVAESPELHLGPHVDAWCMRDGRLAVTDGRSDESGTYVLSLEWRGEEAGVGQARAAVFALVGSFAESATYVRQRRVTGDDGAAGLRFEVGTGELDPGSGFRAHGHSVVITVTGAL
jgi:hypothetical protein